MSRRYAVMSGASMILLMKEEIFMRFERGRGIKGIDTQSERFVWE